MMRNSEKTNSGSIPALLVFSEFLIIQRAKRGTATA